MKTVLLIALTVVFSSFAQAKTKLVVEACREGAGVESVPRFVGTVTVDVPSSGSSSISQMLEGRYIVTGQATTEDGSVTVEATVLDKKTFKKAFIDVVYPIQTSKLAVNVGAACTLPAEVSDYPAASLVIVP